MQDIILHGDAREKAALIPDKCAHCIVTSPPYYGLRDYGKDGQMGLEETPELFIAGLVDLFRIYREKLRDDGTLWVNIGDSYASNAKNRTEEQAKKRSGIGGSIESKLQNLRQQNKITDGLKPKDLMGIPWMLAFALRADGWYLRQDIIWNKTTCMPESVKDRCTKSHEYIFLLSKSNKYYFDHEAIMEPIAASAAKDTRLLTEDYTTARPARDTLGNPSQGSGVLKPASWKGSSFKDGRTNEMQVTRGGKGNRKTFRGGRVYTNNQSFENHISVENNSIGNKPSDSYLRNKRSVWHVAPAQFKEAHFATFPEKLIVDCIKAGCPEGGIVIDPFMGAGTTGIVARKLNRHYIGVELNEKYIDIATNRLQQSLGLFI